MRQATRPAIQADVRKSEDALDRYFNAFESGRMSESACGPRIEALGERLRALRARHAELTAAMEEEQLAGPSPEDLEALRARIRDAIEDGPVARRKAVLQELVVGERPQAPVFDPGMILAEMMVERGCRLPAELHRLRRAETPEVASAPSCSELQAAGYR